MATSVPTVRPGKAYAWHGFGRGDTVAKSAVPVTDLTPLVSERGWFNVVRESFTGAWQRNVTVRREDVTAHSAVYANVTLIASDISKMGLSLVELDSDGIWSPIFSAAFSPVLRKPNRYQNRIKFIEQWLVSKLLHGNTYVLKQRDQRGVVIALYILDPLRTKPLVTPDGEIYYQCSRDNLAGIEDAIVIPASEIIHDTMVPLFHPLVGVSPIYACGMAAMQGLAIQHNSTRFFQNGATPGGVLTAPGTIDEDTAKRLKSHWEQNYSGENAGRVAVLGDGLKYERMVMTSVEAQMIEQLKWTAETVCSCFHVPPYMIGVGAYPIGGNIQATNQQYYSQALQTHIESIELLLDEGLALPNTPAQTYGTEFDVDGGLLRMDTASQYKTLGDGIGAALLAPNEGRRKINLKPLPGGDSVFMQQQNFSLEALARRDQSDDPFALAPKRDQNTPTQAQQDAAAAAASEPPPAKALDAAATAQLAAWEFKRAMDSLPPLAA